MTLAITKHATISDCGHFRYRLGRRWGDGKALLFVMLNPSTADAEVDDRTVKKCMRFAADHGFEALEVTNLFAFRTSSPKELKRVGYLVGPENDAHIAAAVADTQAVCLAWGSAGAETRRPAQVLQLLRGLGVAPQFLRITKSGHPEHPLYLPGELRMQPFTIQAVDDAMQGDRL